MSNNLLGSKDIFPDEAVLQENLGEIYMVFKEMMNKLMSPDFNLTAQWNYYNDGKSWLCKVSFKKKTVFWLSVWDDCYKVGFYFTEKTKDGVLYLEIDEAVKQDFLSEKSIGKLLPLTMEISNSNQLEDLYKIAEYKKIN
jgi:hypothetical protein